MNERRFSGEIERLRAPERVAWLEINRVVDLSMAAPVPRSMLDIGTGSALFAEAFAARGLKVAGVDLREDMLEAARQFVPDGDFRQSHMESLPFPDESFDLVFMGLVLHEADHLNNALSEAYRAARQRVMILEWPYEAAEFGPPLNHRLQPQQILDAAHAVGFKGMEQIVLKHLTLFHLEKVRIL
ncbi:MAG: class I SAM-dependent methyltransferase [Chloroflexota bacterium]